MRRIVTRAFSLAALALAPLPALHSAEPLAAFSPNGRILFQGDSITDGNRGRSSDPNHILGHGFVFIIAARNGAAFPELQLDFLNRGVSGNTVLDLEKRWQKDALDLKPDLLSILIGVNDNGKSVPLDQYEQVYDKLIIEAKTANPALKLVLCEPFVKLRTSEEGIKRRREIVAGLAQKHGAALVRFQRVFDEATKLRRPTTGSGTTCIRPIAAISSWPTNGNALCVTFGNSQSHEMSVPTTGETQASSNRSIQSHFRP